MFHYTWVRGTMGNKAFHRKRIGGVDRIFTYKRIEIVYIQNIAFSPKN